MLNYIWSRTYFNLAILLKLRGNPSKKLHHEEHNIQQCI